MPRRIPWLHDLLEFRSALKWLVLSSLIGVVAGLGAMAFQFLSQSVANYTLSHIAGYQLPETEGEHSVFPHRENDLQPILLLVVLVGGGVASGFLVFKFAPEAEGHGTDAAIDAFHNKGGFIRTRVPVVKTFASAITIGTGGSGGREGPIAQIGAGFGSFLATRLKLSARDRRIMLAAGMGAGVGAIFRAPLAGALFAGEILYRDADLEAEVIVPAAIASIVGYSIFSLALPAGKQFVPLFGTRLNYQLTSVAELLPLTLLAVVLAIVGVIYIKTFYGTQKVFNQLPMPRIAKPALGAFLTGVVALAFYYLAGRDFDSLAVLSAGYGPLQKSLNPSVAGQEGFAVASGLLLAIAALKILTTSLTIGSGGSGGVFGPSMVIGGCVGAAFGQIGHIVAPEWIPTPQIYAIVGMAGFFAGCAHAPFSTIIMVSEMTGSYKLLLPSMWVCMLCFLLGQRWSLYRKQVKSRLESPAHRGDFVVDLLEGIRVSEVYRPLADQRLIPEGMLLDDVVHQLAETTQMYFPVVDQNDRMVGIFSANDVRSYLFDESLWQLANARDLMTTKVVTLSLDDDLNTAMRHFTNLNVDELPVIDSGESGRVLGMLRRKETIAAYNRRLVELKRRDA